MIIFLLQGCCGSGDDPEDQDGFAMVKVEWPNGAQPHPIRVLFYDETGALVLEAETATDNLKAALPAGNYRVVVHNTDAKQVGYFGMDNYESAQVHAQHTQGDDMPGRPCILQPQTVFATGCCKEFPEMKIVAGETRTATVVPQSRTKSLNLYFGMQNTDNIQAVKGMLNGVVPGVFLASGQNVASSVCSVEFLAEYQTRGTGGYGTNVGYFNLAIDKDSPAGNNTLDVTVVDANGSEHTSTVDMTEIFKEIIKGNGGDTPGDIPIEMDVELKLAEDFSVTVVPWDESGSGGGNPRPTK